MPTSTPDSTPEPLRADLERAQARLAQAELEYEQMLAEPGAIQEDRDSSRLVLEQARGAVQALEQALERLDSGTYGRCTVCGRQIPQERLEAVPDAVACRDCSA